MPDKNNANGWHTSNGSFNEHCNFMLKCCSKKWAPQSMWNDYLITFLVDSWKQLLPSEQLEHSMSNCQACCRNHANLQAAFPALPRYTAPSSIVHLPCCEESAADTTRKVLAELKKTYEKAFGQSFTEAAVQYCGCSEGTDK